MGGFNSMSKIGEGIIAVLKELENSDIEDEILHHIASGFDVDDVQTKILDKWKANAWHIVEKPTTVEGEFKEELFDKLRKYSLVDLEYRIGMMFPGEV